MATYSMTTARAGLPRLIDKAIAGEEVIITRRGKPVAKLLAAPAMHPAARPAFYAWLAARRTRPTEPKPNSVQLLNLIYSESR
jgi:prevent-host-death family protein